MTYHPIPTGGILFGDESECTRKGEAASADIERQRDDLAATWRPTGFYRVGDLTRMRDQVLQALLAASASVDKAVAAGVTPDIRNNLRMAQGALQSKMADALPFTTAIHQANAKGIQVIDAPAFKRWVIESLTKISVATAYVAYQACLKPAVVAALHAVVRACQSLIALGKSIVSATLAVGEQILKVPDHLDTLWTVTKWGALAVAAFYAIRPRRSNPWRSPHRR